MTTRLTWEQLPDATRSRVEALTGLVQATEHVASGRNSELAAILHTTGRGVFVKGLRTNDRRVRTQRREALINPYVRRVAPVLQWHLHDIDGWDVLGFDAVIGGRHADMRPGSADLPFIAETLQRLGQIGCPADLDLDCIERRWSDYADPQDLQFLRGDSLLHTDLRPDNLLLAGEGACIVDWAWPTRGAGWIDPAGVALWLIAEGHSPRIAEAWLTQLPAGRAVPARALDAFVLVNLRLWSEAAAHDPQPWKGRLAHAANTWAVTRENHRADLRRTVGANGARGLRP